MTRNSLKRKFNELKKAIGENYEFGTEYRAKYLMMYGIEPFHIIYSLRVQDLDNLDIGFNKKEQVIEIELKVLDIKKDLNPRIDIIKMLRENLESNNIDYSKCYVSIVFKNSPKYKNSIYIGSGLNSGNLELQKTEGTGRKKEVRTGEYIKITELIKTGFNERMVDEMRKMTEEEGGSELQKEDNIEIVNMMTGKICDEISHIRDESCIASKYIDRARCPLVVPDGILNENINMRLRNILRYSKCLGYLNDKNTNIYEYTKRIRDFVVMDSDENTEKEYNMIKESINRYWTILKFFEIDIDEILMELSKQKWVKWRGIDNGLQDSKKDFFNLRIQQTQELLEMINQRNINKLKKMMNRLQNLAWKLDNIIIANGRFTRPDTLENDSDTLKYNMRHFIDCTSKLNDSLSNIDSTYKVLSETASVHNYQRIMANIIRLFILDLLNLRDINNSTEPSMMEMLDKMDKDMSGADTVLGISLNKSEINEITSQIQELLNYNIDTMIDNIINDLDKAVKMTTNWDFTLTYLTILENNLKLN